jgi:hypothetical protein
MHRDLILYLELHPQLLLQQLVGGEEEEHIKTLQMLLQHHLVEGEEEEPRQLNYRQIITYLMNICS